MPHGARATAAGCALILLRPARCWLIIALFAAFGALSSQSARADDAAEEIALRPPVEVEMISREKWDRSTAEASYVGVHAANKQGDAEWIVEGFVPEEREAIKQRVGDKQLLDANTELFESIVSETITKKILYRGHVILVVEALRKDGRRSLRNIPMRMSGRDWLLTNDLASDKVFLGLTSGYIDR